MKQKFLFIFLIIIVVGGYFLFYKIPLTGQRSTEVNPNNQDNLPIVIIGATPPGALDLASRVIKKNGSDKTAGFQIELRPIFPEGAVPALTKGTVDIISIAPLTAVGLIGQNEPIVFLANGIKVDCPFFVNENSQATNWQDLKGKRLGTTSETGPSFTLFKVAMKAKEGIDVDEYFQISHSPFAELIPRLTRGEIDGAIGRCSEVGIAQAIVDAKFKVIGNITDILFRDGEFSELMTDGVVANKKWVEDHRDLANKFQKTLYQAYEYIKSHPEVYDDPDVQKAYAIEDARPEVISSIKQQVNTFYTFVDWSNLINSQYHFFELAQEHGLLDSLPPKEQLFFNE